jgi:hypothetical protein
MDPMRQAVGVERNGIAVSVWRFRLNATECYQNGGAGGTMSCEVNELRLRVPFCTRKDHTSIAVHVPARSFMFFRDIAPPECTGVHGSVRANATNSNHT